MQSRSRAGMVSLTPAALACFDPWPVSRAIAADALPRAAKNPWPRGGRG